MRQLFILSLILFLVMPCSEAEVLRLDAEIAARRVIEVSALGDAATSRIDTASASVDAADAERMPYLRISAAVGQRNSVPELWANMNGPLQPPVLFYPSIETTGQGSIQLDQVIYAGGAVHAGREATRRDLDGASAERETLWADLSLRARLAYWDAVATRAGLNAARAQEQRATRLLADAQALREAGMAVRADVLSAEARLATAQVEVIVHGAEADNAEAALRSLLEITDEVELVMSHAVAIPTHPPGLAVLRKEAIESRTELDMVDSRSASLIHREQAVNSARKPAVALGAHWMVAKPNVRYFPLEDTWNDSWGVDLRATWTLFDGHRTRADAAVVRYQRQTLESDRKEMVRYISLEVETAHRDLVSALAAIDATTASVRAADSREEAVQERYEAGLAPISDVLDAQADLADAELSEIVARAAAWIADARLKRALGSHAS